MFTVNNLKSYADLGFQLFPVNQNSKRPLTEHGFKDATTNLNQLTEWFDRFKGCAWGTPTSSSAGVVEYDKRHDLDGSIWNNQVGDKLFPETWKSQSGGGSPHFWFKWPEGTSSAERFGSALGRKANGGYVIIPPSKLTLQSHTEPYKWILSPLNGTIAEAPDWLIQLFTVKDQPKLSNNEIDPWIVKASNADLLTHEGCSKSKGEQRTPMLLKLVGVHIARGDSISTVKAMAKVWASKCEPELDVWEKHVDGLFANEEAKGFQSTPNKYKIDIEEIVSGKPIEEEVSAIAFGKTSSSSSTLSYGVNPETSSSSSASSNDDFVFDDAVSSDQAKTFYAFPKLSADAYHGLFGEMLQAVQAETEADPAAILIGWLTCFGGVLGRTASITQPDLHFPALFVGVVGKTSDAKGVAWNVVQWPFGKVESQWAKNAICHGVSSGQGLIDRVRDEQKTFSLNKKSGVVEEKVIPGSPEKRCLVRLDELSVCFKMQASEKSTLGETLLTAWGGSQLETPNVSQGENYRKANDYAISFYGDTQPQAIRKILDGGRIETVNGWLNRFLWVAARGQRDIPRPKPLDSILTPFLSRLKAALDFSKSAGELQWADDAGKAWDEVYGELKRSGDTVPHTDRARGQVLRLAMLFALVDSSKVIRLAHLYAALAAWAYCRESAALIFGGTARSQPFEADPLWLEVLNFLPETDGVERWKINEKFKPKATTEKVGETLEALANAGKAEVVKLATGGRVAEKWKRRFPDDTNETKTKTSSSEKATEEEEEVLTEEQKQASEKVEEEEEEEEEEVQASVVGQTSSSSSPYPAEHLSSKTSSSSSGILPTPVNEKDSSVFDSLVSSEKQSTVRGLL